MGHERGILLKSSSILGCGWRNYTSWCHMMDLVLLIKWHHQSKSTTSFLNLNSQSELLLLYSGYGHLERLSNEMLPFKAKWNVSEPHGCSLLHTTIQLPLEQFSAKCPPALPRPPFSSLFDTETLCKFEWSNLRVFMRAQHVPVNVTPTCCSRKSEQQLHEVASNC